MIHADCRIKCNLGQITVDSIVKSLYQWFSTYETRTTLRISSDYLWNAKTVQNHFKIWLFSATNYHKCLRVRCHYSSSLKRLLRKHLFNLRFKSLLICRRIVKWIILFLPKHGRRVEYQSEKILDPAQKGWNPMQLVITMKPNIRGVASLSSGTVRFSNLRNS